MPPSGTDAAMVNFARARLQYATDLIRSGGNLEAISAELALEVARQVGNITTINPEAAKDVIEMVESSSIMEGDKAAIYTAVQGKVRLAIGRSSDDPEIKQSFLKFPEYIQSGLAIAQIYDPERQRKADFRLKKLAEFLRDMGCNHPSERTMAIVAACAVPEATTGGSRRTKGGAW